MNKNWPFVVLAALLAAGGIYGVRAYRASHGGAASVAQAAGYHCPMHPAFTSDKPGSCKICGMTLVPDETSPDAAAAAAAGKKICVLHHCTMAHCEMELTLESGKKAYCPVCGESEEVTASSTTILYYRNPMHPEVTAPGPRKDEMGMDYIPVYAEAGAPSTVSGQGNLALTEERRQMIGMKSTAVARRELAVVVRASGKVAYDPELYQAITEYREAAKARDAVKDSSWPDVPW